MQACHNSPWEIPFTVPIKLLATTSQSRPEEQVRTLQQLKLSISNSVEGIRSNQNK